MELEGKNFAEFPPRMECALTSYGKSLMTLMRPIQICGLADTKSSGG
jgi:hypothetical protein